VELESGSNPKNQWVFSSASLDFGGLTSVRGYTGLATFSASFYWMGGEGVTYPKAWSTGDLGRGCNTPKPRNTQMVNLSARVTDVNMLEAASVVLSTALPTAFQSWGSTLGTTVLLYPLTRGSFDPEKAEFIVLLDGGWLD
jgi:hypothetical protein